MDEVSGSKAAVKYKHAIDLFEQRVAEDPSYTYRTLVAVSGAVRIDEDEVWASDWGPAPSKDGEFTEANMNPGAGADLAAAFKGDTYKIMLVANKFQTGFDQPLLSAMYVDKKPSGVTAVQTPAVPGVPGLPSSGPRGGRRQPGAHNTMSDSFFSDGPGIKGIIRPLADAFYEAAIDEPASA